jgi:hypothetical protein
MNDTKYNNQTNSKIGSTWTKDENISLIKREFLSDNNIETDVNRYISD